MNRNL